MAAQVETVDHVVEVALGLGLGREIVVRQYLGVTTLEATAFDIASRFPEAIFLIVAGGAIGSAFIPTFAAYLSREDEEGSWRLFSSVLNLLTLTTTAISVLVMLLAAPFVTFFYADNIAQEGRLQSNDRTQIMSSPANSQCGGTSQ